jgi:YbbR domain-containing protein
MKNLSSKNLLNNVLWFALSLVTAFFIWVIATFQIDPIIAERLPQQVHVQIQIDTGMLITNSPRDTVTVTLRGQESVLGALTVDDIIVRADLAGLGPGEHTVPLLAEIVGEPRAVIEDVSPRQLHVVLEEVSQQFVSVQANIIDAIPVGYANDPPVFDSTQVLVSGAASNVVRVVAARAEISLANRRNSFDEVARLVPVDVDGQTVFGLTLEPAQVNVSVTIRQRDDIREITVTPNIVIDDLPEGYRLTSVSYNPETILVGGAPELLQNIPNTLFTEPVELAARTESFEVTVPVILPNEALLVLSEQSVTITVGIAALETTARYDDVPIGVIGLGQGYMTTLAPSSVTVLLTGAQPMLDGLTASSIQVLLDLNGLTAGNYQLQPMVSVNGVTIPAENIAVLPSEIDISIVNGADVTPTITPTITPTATLDFTPTLTPTMTRTVRPTGTRTTPSPTSTP